MPDLGGGIIIDIDIQGTFYHNSAHLLLYNAVSLTSYCNLAARISLKLLVLCSTLNKSGQSPVPEIPLTLHQI